MRLVFLGPPGAGKGTWAMALAGELDLVHISTGDLLREAVGRQDPLGVEAKRYMEQGELVPDGLVIRLVVERLQQPDAQGGFILDGFPRTLPQAEALDEALNREGRPIDLVIDFETSEEIIIRRLSGRVICSACQAIYHREAMPTRQTGICDRCGGQLVQRGDDRPETIRERLAVYRQEAAPLVRYYRGRHLLARTNGNLKVQEGLAELKQLLRSRGLTAS